jgi:hypothetical protein
MPHLKTTTTEPSLAFAHPGIHASALASAPAPARAGKASRLLRNLLLVPAALAALAMATGCASKAGQKEYAKAFAVGNYTKAREVGVKVVGEEIDSRDSLYWQLHIGTASQLLGDAPDAAKNFSRAERAFVEFDAEAALKSAGDYAKSMASNDTALPYTGKIYERIMLLPELALSFLAQDDIEKARPTLNRLENWQSDAVKRFTDELDKEAQASKEAAKGQNFGNLPTPDKVIPKLRNAVNADRKYTPPPNQSIEAVVWNPFATHLAGLVARLEGEYEKAENHLKKAAALVPESKLLAADAANARRPAKNQVWVIVENGLCPKLEEFRVDLAALLVIKNAPLVTFAIPKLVTRIPTYAQFTVFADGAKHTSEAICDLDQIALLEYDKSLPGAIARETTRAILKATAQIVAEKVAENAGGALAGFAAKLTVAVGSAVLTGADTRQWTTLPANVHLLALPIPQDRILSLRATTGAGNIQIAIPEKAKNAIVHVRIPSDFARAGKPNVIAFK